SRRSVPTPPRGHTRESAPRRPFRKRGRPTPARAHPALCSCPPAHLEAQRRRSRQPAARAPTSALRVRTRRLRTLPAPLPATRLLTLTEFVEQARNITQATTLPLLGDADTGFGEALNVERTVRLFEAAWVAGIHLEDQQLPKRCGHLSGKQLVEPEVMAAK